MLDPGSVYRQTERETLDPPIFFCTVQYSLILVSPITSLFFYFILLIFYFFIFLFIIIIFY